MTCATNVPAFVDAGRCAAQIVRVKVVDPKRPCSEQSVNAGEPIHGTAVAEVETWLLIEYRERWARDVMECEWPEGVLAWLQKTVDSTRRLRVQLIRQPGRVDGDLAVYVVTTGSRARIRRLNIASHAELPTLDLPSLIADVTPQPTDPKNLYLVCVHGKRDRCCALHGIAVHRVLDEQDLDGELWQSSHQGGHRFAATMLYLPLGVHYGRLEPEDMQPLAEAHARGMLYDLNRYRGATRMSLPIQSAEAWLREQEMELGFNDVEYVEHKLNADGSWEAAFRSRGKLHRLTVVARTGEYGRMTSCNAEASTLPTFHYVVRHAAQTLA